MANRKNQKREVKDFMIRVRVTTEEHEKFLKKAVEKGYRYVSAYIRSLVEEEAESDGKSVL